MRNALVNRLTRYAFKLALIGLLLICLAYLAGFAAAVIWVLFYYFTSGLWT